jgi:hypothetical protein
MQFIIPNFFSQIDHVSPKKLFWWIVAASILLAAWMQYIQHGWINPDTVLYFEQARLIALGDWAGAVKVFNWPLYGACIAAVHTITGFGIHLSAQLLNMLFFGLATASFLMIIQLAGGGTRVMLAGTLLLFGGQYLVGDVLEMLMRDEGFWAFYLTSLVFFIRYVQQNKLPDALLWQVCIIIATLFRIEAICYLIGLPLCLLLIKNLSWKARIKNMLNAYSIAFVACVAIALAFLLNNDLRMKHFGRLQEVFSLNLYQEFTHKLMTQAHIMSNQVLGNYLDEFAITGLLLTFLYVMAAKTFTAAGLFATIFAGFTLKNRGATIEPKAYLVLKTAAIVALTSMALIIVKVFVLSSRYAAGLSWILLVLGAFYFASMFANKDKKIALITSLVVIALCLGLVKNILPKRQGYNYMQEAATWLRQHNSEQAPVFYNETRMRYYMAEPFVGVWEDNGKLVSDAIENKTINQYTFLVVAQSTKKLEENTLISKQLTNFTEVKRFNSFKAKNSIVIYRKNTH